MPQRQKAAQVLAAASLRNFKTTEKGKKITGHLNYLVTLTHNSITKII
jgi:hypothetical protein